MTKQINNEVSGSSLRRGVGTKCLYSSTTLSFINKILLPCKIFLEASGIFVFILA